MGEDGTTPEIARIPNGISMLGRIPQYDGKMSFVKYLSSFNKRAILEGWTDQQKATIIKVLCTGLAESFIDANKQLETANFEQICNALENRFSIRLSKPEAYAELLLITQGRMMVDEYAARIESKSSELSSILTELGEEETRDEMLIPVFIKGLNPRIRNLMSAAVHTDFNVAVKAAKRCEISVNDGTRQICELRFAPPRVKPQEIWQNIQCWECGKFGHMQRHCRRVRDNYRDEQNYSGQRSWRSDPRKGKYNPRMNPKLSELQYGSKN